MTFVPARWTPHGERVTAMGMGCARPPPVRRAALVERVAEYPPDVRGEAGAEELRAGDPEQALGGQVSVLEHPGVDEGDPLLGVRARAGAEPVRAHAADVA